MNCSRNYFSISSLYQMKVKYIILFFLLLFCYKSNAQNCNCSDNFNYLVKRIEKNYIGYSDKINSINKSNFKKFTDSLKSEAANSNSYKCLSICREWLDFFKDQHLTFGMDFEKLSPDSVRKFFSDEEKTNWNKDSFKSYLTNNRNNLDSIEGIWNYGIYEIGIVRDTTKRDTEFIAFITKADSMRWMPQQIKFRLAKSNGSYKTIYFNGGDHSRSTPIINKQIDGLNFGIFGNWHKGEKITKNTQNNPIQQDMNPKFSQLDEKTSLIILPSFEGIYKLKIDSLVDKNQNNLSKTEHLIIDVRDNEGGTTSSFEKLIPYLYTNPIRVDGGIVLATEENIRDCYDKEYPYATSRERIELKNNVKKLKSHLGEKYLLYKPHTIKLSKILKNPKRISILMNSNTASSGELFILRAEQSKKVKLYGSNTAGMVDYGEIVKILLPCKYYTLFYPASKSLHSIKRPLDNIGIAPTVQITEDTVDWVTFVKNYK